VKCSIKGKEYTELDIKRRCCEINMIAGFCEDENGIYDLRNERYFDPFSNWNDAGPIIEKCWDELMVKHPIREGFRVLTEWECIAEKHNCTKLVAACICYIEINHSETI
jgi:hypothetical protein